MSTVFNADQGDLMPGAELYGSLGASYEKAFAHDAGLLEFIQKVLSLLKPRSRVLDAGCGTGSPVAKTIALQGHQITGIDISREMIDLSRKAVPNGYFEVANMLEYAPTEPVDAVLNILSLFLLKREDMEAMCFKWAQWLLPDGILCVCTVPAESCQPGKEMYDEDGLCVRHQGAHFMGRSIEVTLMTREGWEIILGRAGFEIIHTEENVFEPPPEAKSDPETHYYIIARKRQ